MKKYLIISVILLLTVTTFLPFNGCTCDDTQVSTTFMELLKLAPADTLSNGEIILINYSKIWEDSGISFYRKDGSKMNREETLDGLLSITTHIPGDKAFNFSSFYSGMDKSAIISPIQTDTLGYNIVADVHAEIIQGYYYNNFNMVAMIGNFSLQATRDALQNQGDWPEWAVEDFSTESYLGIPIYSWGDNTDISSSDFYSSYLPPHLDDNGIARPLAAMDGYMLIGGTEDIVKTMISSVKGETPSLADVPEYALIAEAMDSFDVYAVMMSVRMIRSLILPLGQYLAVGYGDGNNEQGNYSAVVAVYDNEDMAKESASILEETLKEVAIKWNTGSEFADIRCDGRVLIATLYINENTLGYSWNSLVLGHR
jgi:hypothetical protein